ncbi:MAG: hypothetical protein WED87_09600, partial [Dehalococcoidia bacterium]
MAMAVYLKVDGDRFYLPRRVASGDFVHCEAARGSDTLRGNMAHTLVHVSITANATVTGPRASVGASTA